MEACAVICRKATFTISVSAVMLPDANFLSSRCQSPSSRAQNRGFCALLPEGGRPLAGDAYGKKVYIQGTMPELKARCQN